MSGHFSVIILGLVSSLFWSSAPAFAQTAPGGNEPADTKTSVFALVVGVNRPLDAGTQPLRYADDDAIRYGELFRAVGADTVVLAHPDRNTRRLHSDEARAARAPTQRALFAAAAEFGRKVRLARLAGHRTAFYFAYAGHGQARGQAGVITLEDAELGGPLLLAEVVDRVGAERSHLIVDACYSFFALLGRSAGGRVEPRQGFSRLGGLAEREDVGLFLSTSSARESHEWGAYQAGVFSHEVRSGLHGAADVDQDGVVTYVELAAFVDRANAAIVNEQFRPEPFVRPPSGAAALLDLRPAQVGRIEVDEQHRGHHYLEDPLGVRWLDFHNAGALRILRPTAARLYLRRASEDREFVLPEGEPTVDTSLLVLRDAQVAARGAAHDVFRQLFALPFGQRAVADYRSRAPAERALAPTQVTAPSSEASPEGSNPRLGPTLLAGAGTAALLGGVATWLGARGLRGDIGPQTDQATVARTNQAIANRNRWASGLVGLGTATVGAALIWWLADSPDLELAAGPGGFSAAYRRRF